MNYYVMEFLGTFFIMLTIIFSGEPWAIGLLYTALMYIDNDNLKGYYNPAIATSLWKNSTISSTNFMGCCTAQILGATGAALYFYLISGDYFMFELPAGIAFIDIALREMLFTFILCSVTLFTTQRTEFRHHAGMIIGLTLAAILSMGGLYNPALFLGTLFCTIPELPMPFAKHFITFACAPFAGALLASYFFASCKRQEQIVR